MFYELYNACDIIGYFITKERLWEYLKNEYCEEWSYFDNKGEEELFKNMMLFPSEKTKLDYLESIEMGINEKSFK